MFEITDEKQLIFDIYQNVGKQMSLKTKILPVIRVQAWNRLTEKKQILLQQLHMQRLQEPQTDHASISKPSAERQRKNSTN